MLPENLEQSLMALSKLVECERSSIWVIRNNTLIPLRLQYVREDVEKKIHLPLSNSCSGLADSCAVTGEFSIVNKTALELKIHSDLEKTLEYYVNSSMVVPILINGRCAGVIQCLNKEGGFTQHDYITVSAVAQNGSSFISMPEYYSDETNVGRVEFYSRSEFCEFCIPILARLWNAFKTLSVVQSFEDTNKDRAFFYKTFFLQKKERISVDSKLIEEAANALRLTFSNDQNIKELCHQVIAALTPISFALKVEKIFVFEIEQNAEGTYKNTLQRTSEELYDRFSTVTANIARLYKLLRPGFNAKRKLVLCDYKKFLLNSYADFFGAYIRHSKKHAIRFLVEDKTNGATILTDAEKLTEIIESILINGAEALADSNTQEPEVKLVFQPCDGGVIFTISDNVKGGISEKVQSRIFDKNFTTKEDGNGIGLAIAKEIIESLGGEISFESGLHGTIFMIKLAGLAQGESK